MQIPCPTCQTQVNLKSAPIRGNANDGTEAWVCLKCASIICVYCYHEHAKKHPEMTKELKKPKKK